NGCDASGALRRAGRSPSTISGFQRLRDGDDVELTYRWSDMPNLVATHAMSAVRLSPLYPCTSPPWMRRGGSSARCPTQAHLRTGVSLGGVMVTAPASELTATPTGQTCERRWH